ncbi:heat-inducible transcriptional repressor HrcA, partial [Burkholderia multivorans]
EQKIVGLAEAVDEEDLARIRERINAEFAGRKLSRIDLGEAAGAAESDHAPAEGMAEVPGGEATSARLRDAVIDLVAATREERIIMAGTANLARSGKEFGEQMAPILEAFEEQVVLLKLLTSMAEDHAEISVRIGRENTH